MKQCIKKYTSLFEVHIEDEIKKIFLKHFDHKQVEYDSNATKFKDRASFKGKVTLEGNSIEFNGEHHTNFSFPLFDVTSYHFDQHNNQLVLKKKQQTLTLTLI